MSVREIIQHSLDKNPLAMKEALEEEMKSRVAEAIEEKMLAAMTEASDDDEDVKESFDLSDYTVEELEDFMMSEDFDQLDEISQDAVYDFYYEALTPEQRKAREANRTDGRLGKHDPEARQFFHTDLRGKKGAERTATGRNPVSGSFLTKHGRAGMSKIGTHGAAGGGHLGFKPNAKTSLARTKMIGRRVKGKLPESNE